MVVKSVRFCGELSSPNVEDVSVFFVGQLEHLRKIDYVHIEKKTAGVVSKKVWEAGLEELSPTNHNSDYCNLFLKDVAVGALPKECSRHSSEARGTFLTKLVKTYLSNKDSDSIVLVCRKVDALASAIAIGRSVALFNMKTSSIGLTQSVLNVDFIIVNEEENELEFLCEQDTDAITQVVASTRQAAYMVDSPCNFMNTTEFMNQVRKLVGELPGVRTSMIIGEELRDRGMGAIWGVGKGAANPPAMVILSYEGGNADLFPIVAWVGKGIVFDTGGLNIKTPKTAMCGMKRDMGGAAAVLNAFVASVKLGYQGKLHAVLCLAENAISAHSTRPDDILTSYSGKTIEINNTDAEGRLVLADGVSYAKKDLNADIIVDMATLTGAQGISTGKTHAAVVSNSEYLQSKAILAGSASGDMVYPLVYAPEYHYGEFRSVVADMKNSVADRSNAQSSCAGLFILSHLGFNWSGNWLHIDIAAPAYSGERATGFGVALLVTLFAQLSNNSFMRSLPETYSNHIYHRKPEDTTKLAKVVGSWSTN